LWLLRLCVNLYKRIMSEELQQMQYILQEAIENKQKIRVITYHPFENRVYEGIPTTKGNALYLTSEHGMIPLLINEVVCLEQISD